MIELMFWTTQRNPNDQPLTKAARVALEVDQTPRMIHFTVGQDGQPIEIPNGNPLPQIDLF